MDGKLRLAELEILSRAGLLLESGFPRVLDEMYLSISLFWSDFVSKHSSS